MTSAMTYSGASKFRTEGPWVKIQSDGEWRYVLCEQIRYADRSRCGDERGTLSPTDLAQVEAVLKKLFAPDV
jgi:mRNA-degrading endonuclease toxin of MazEF toxin-antitoxin module